MKTYAMKDWLLPKSHARDISTGALSVFSGDINKIPMAVYSVSQVRR
jgi:hypothetical protein